MNLTEASGLIGAIVGFILTIMVFSYLLGDNVLFRLATHIFIGVAAGYVAAVTFTNVIVPRLLDPLLAGQLTVLVPLLGAVLLLTRLTRRFGGLGAPVMAFLVGVGAAAAIGGAVLGTLLPQIGATFAHFDMQALAAAGKTSLGFELLNGAIILVGAVATLAYFQFGVRSTPGLPPRPFWQQILAMIGQGFVALAFGAVFAGVYAAAMAALVERMDAILQLIRMLIAPAA
jgi:hypothetical protein